MIEEKASNRLDQAPPAPPFSNSALKVLRERYLLRDDSGVPVEDVDQMLAN
jgi:hypothetical protein